MVLTVCQLQTSAWRRFLCFPWFLLPLAPQIINGPQLTYRSKGDETSGAEWPKPMTSSKEQSCLHRCRLENSLAESSFHQPNPCDYEKSILFYAIEFWVGPLFKPTVARVNDSKSWELDSRGLECRWMRNSCTITRVCKRQRMAFKLHSA